MADNAGATDADRAVNYCALRYPAIYARAAESFAANASLTGLEVRPSPLSGTRKMVEVIFSYTNRSSDVTESSSSRAQRDGGVPVPALKVVALLRSIKQNPSRRIINGIARIQRRDVLVQDQCPILLDEGFNPSRWYYARTALSQAQDKFESLAIGVRSQIRGHKGGRT